MVSSSQFLENLLKQIVNLPEEVKVSEQEGVLEISANQSDLGMIIGKNGKNIRGLRGVVNLKTAKEGGPRLELKIHEEVTDKQSQNETA